MPLSEEQRKRLNADLPADAVKTRAAKGGGDDGAALSYVDGFYVFDSLNRIVGPGSWGYEVKRLDLVHRGTSERNGKTRAHVSYLAVVRLDVEGARAIEDVGYGSGIDADEGAAHEKASKEAITDAVKRCSRALGRAMGLALYDKDQTYVTEEQPRHPQRLAECRTAEELQGWLGTYGPGFRGKVNGERERLVSAVRTVAGKVGVSEEQAMRWLGGES